MWWEHMRRERTREVCLALIVCGALWHAPGYAVNADADSLLAVADGDTIAVLLDIVEDLELEIRLQEITIAAQRVELARLTPKWYEIVWNKTEPFVYVLGAVMVMRAME